MSADRYHVSLRRAALPSVRQGAPAGPPSSQQPGPRSGRGSNADAAIDALSLILAEIGCNDSTIEVVLVLAGMLAAQVEASRHRDQWIAHFELQLIRALDQLKAER